MIEVVYLCAMLIGGQQCLPFRDMDACMDAEARLATPRIIESECQYAEVLTNLAPLTSPTPKEKPDEKR